METRGDDDIEFDFFDEPATAETQSSPRIRLPRPGLRSGGSSGPPHGVVPVLRLTAFVVFVIVIVLVFALVIQSCASSSRHSAYAGYLDRVDTIAAQSSANGKAVANALTALKVNEIVSKLQGIADQERQNVRAAERLDPPGRLRDENQYLIQALQLRAAGIDSLATAFQQTAGSKNNSKDANALADQADRLLASDVVWDDFFRALTVNQLQRDGISGITVPESHSIANTLVTPHAMALVLQRVRGASTGGTVTGLHGTNIISTKANPGGQVLSSDSLNTVTASTDLSIAVTVEDSGDFQETHIPVTLTITGGANRAPIVKTQEIQLINPGEQATVTFTDLGAVSIATEQTLKIDVKPVPGEIKTDNNSAQYPIILSLPG
jgi:hypothetical protein